MPRSTITVDDLGADMKLGSAISEDASDASNEHQFTNSGHEVLIVNNKAASASAVAVTVVSVADEYGRTGDVTETVAIGEVRAFGPFSPSRFNQTGALVHVDLDVSDASCVLSVVKLTPHERCF